MTTPLDFEAWYRREHPSVVAALVLIAGEADLAKSAVDEAFLRAYERWERVGLMESPAGWTYRVAVNLVRRSWRRRRLEAALWLSEDDQADGRSARTPRRLRETG